MTQGTRRDRARAETDREIRGQARALLISDGPQAVTLRAIARELGITAPALYRYYASREDLIEHLRADVCADLGNDLDRDLADVAESDHLAQVLAVCRGFRRWALAHPQEFTLVFATPPHDPRKDPVRDSFGRIFLGVAGRILAVGELITPPEQDIPAALVADLTAFRSDLLDSMAATGVSIADSRLGIATAYVMLRFWVRLYGQVALEVFGQFPFPVTDAEPIFESMLADLVREVGLSE
ncbi:DNA-binding transcriptional regulator, AcrR family [Actinokineospora alba]|uniref:DNA-binding transcriptional regulator, AcrR family n=1 Tax=Actinokineospora alba TaxID=504798 RepID=A0A1H0Q8E7_9PSEU|nr:TetR/AcrR family transcriptional regulator [Actinokineospora alba]TDP66102.1 TetR family transcriptional regulator [Actinokineospora alba]SDI58109.1 DNA-binding transcriptional regulator, AcrR family [Actinokineospora alba]SDP12966.1 DNA-binding transcriptional regulator, AcrR family [Actinokineospora alba]